MGRAVVLEQFDTETAMGGDQRQSGVGAESDRLAGYEDGYRAGWDDAIQSQEKMHDKVSSDLAGHLQDLSFTFHEAKSHVLKSIEPLLKDTFSRVLPEAARAALPHLILEQVSDLARKCSDSPVYLTVAPASREALLSVLPQDAGMPLEIREEVTLAEGQVFLRLGDCERQIDTARAAREILDSVETFFADNDERIAANG